MNVSIASIDFWEIITKPSLQDFYTEPQNYRKMVVAIWATDALIEHICWEKYSDQMKADDRAFLEKLANDNINYKTVHEASNSLFFATSKYLLKRTLCVSLFMCQNIVSISQEIFETWRCRWH